MTGSSGEDVVAPGQGEEREIHRVFKIIVVVEHVAGVKNTEVNGVIVKVNQDKYHGNDKGRIETMFVIAHLLY